MRKIYYEDQYKKEFVAEVEAIEEVDESIESIKNNKLLEFDTMNKAAI